MLFRSVTEGKEAAEAILEGYRDGLQADDHPFVLAERHSALGALAVERLKDPENYWEKLEKSSPASRVPRGAVKALSRALPEPGLPRRIYHRIVEKSPAKSRRWRRPLEILSCG